MKNITARLIIGTNAYAVITAPGRSLDVLLNPGRSAAQSLRESAKENRDKAARLVSQAELMETAAGLL